MEADVEQKELACLLIETIDGIASNLCKRGSLTGEIPARYKQWLADRNMDDSQRSREILSRACVFDFYLKSALYSLHESEHEGLAELSVNADFQARFAEAERASQNKGFELSDPADLITEVVESEIQTVLALRSALNATSHPAETLSMVYERLFVQEDRRDLGQFATPNYISNILAEWAIDDAGDTVLDPGVGAGMLSSAAVTEKIQQGATKPLQDIRANDIDELSISMAAVSLKLVDGPGSPVLEKGNFLDITAHDWTESGRIQTEPVDAVVANPPYSRSQALEVDLKSEANQTVSGETGIDFHGKSPLYVYFLAHAAQFVAEGGRLAFIIPSGFMETAFGVPFKRYLVDQFQIDAIVQLDEEENTFRGVRTTTSLVFLQYKQAPEDHETTFINLRRWPDVDSLDDLCETDFDNDSDADGYRVDLLQRLLSPEDNWQHYLSPTETDEITGLKDFTDIATIKRGIATGNNSLFCLNKSDRAEHDIPDRFLKPIIRSAKDIPGYEITQEDWEGWKDGGKDVWLLYAYENDEKITDRGPLEEYLSYAESAFDTDRELFNRRNPWYCVDKREPAPILAKYMSRTGSQFIYNDAELRTLNNFHIIDPDFDSDEQQVKALLAYLNSNIVRKEISKVSRSYSGLKKIELGALKSAPVIDPRELESSVVDRLATLFDKLEKRDRFDGDVDDVRRDIDDMLRDILELSVESDPSVAED
ncbi:N-6 DNA methylase [Haloarchaeobius salinus]|uniref:N-6 DNA methylase n=1 Tax=Haloarchaeobius salinus TaxID=1198298 RepID=UPI0021096C37